jgi:hypothetical protein
MPLLTRLFNTRLDIIAATLNRRDNPAYSQAITDCRSMLTRVPSDSFLVRKVWQEVVTFDIVPNRGKESAENLRVK